MHFSLFVAKVAKADFKVKVGKDVDSPSVVETPTPHILPIPRAKEPKVSPLSQPVKAPNDFPLEYPPFLSVRNRLAFWEQHAPLPILDLIRYGAAGLCEQVCLRSRSQFKTIEEVLEAEKLLKEYMEVGAVQKLPTNFRPQYVVPWFLVCHPKLRLIVDCREINRAMYPPDYFRPPDWSDAYVAMCSYAGSFL